MSAMLEPVLIACAVLAVMVVASVAANVLPKRPRRLLALIPPTFEVEKHDANATNSRTHIVIKAGIVNPGAVQCQERAEWGYKWRRPLMLISPKPEQRRAMEFLGHAIEVEVAVRHYGADRATIELHEAHSLAARDNSQAFAPWHYEQFTGWTAEECLGGLVRARGDAQRWVDRHPGYVRKAVRHA